MIGRDATDTDSVNVRSALQLNCTIVENLDDGEGSSRISAGHNLSFPFVLLKHDEFLVSDFVLIIQPLSILFGIVLNCLTLMESRPFGSCARLSMACVDLRRLSMTP